MSEGQRGKKQLRHELAEMKVKLHNQKTSAEALKNNVLRMVDYATGLAKTLTKAEEALELASGTLDDFANHGDVCAWSAETPCDCGFADALKAIKETLAELKTPPGNIEQMVPAPQAPVETFDAVKWAKAEIEKQEAQIEQEAA